MNYRCGDRFFTNHFHQVILSTGIAETALTIDDVMFVIDSGRIEERVYDAKAGNYAIDSPNY